MRAHSAARTATHTRIISELVIGILLAATQQEPDEQTDEGYAGQGTNDNAGNSTTTEAGTARAASRDGLIFLTGIASSRWHDNDGGYLTADRDG